MWPSDTERKCWKSNSRRLLQEIRLDYIHWPCAWRIEVWFTGVTKAAAMSLCLLPCKVISITSEIEESILQYYKRDLPIASTFHQELMIWKMMWMSANKEELPSTLTATLNHGRVSSKNFPNISTVLHLLLMTPVTAATVERANSALKFVKSDGRSRMVEDRLNAVLVLFIHNDIDIDFDKVVDIFAKRKSRRMHLLNPVGDESSL